jgi:aminoglycoside 6-adenylyltransferase
MNELMAQRYEQWIDRLHAWAQTHPQVFGILVLGSRARTHTPADQWSDLDIVLLVEDPALILHDDQWLASVGTPSISFLESTAAGDLVERRLLFDGILDIDVIPMPLAHAHHMQAHGVPDDVREIFAKGARIVYDSLGILAQISTAPYQPKDQTIDQAEFLNLVNDVWYHAIWIAKKLRRGETWTAKQCCDGFVKYRLLTMLEWHAQSTLKRTTWHAGRFLEQWADPRAVSALSHCFAHYDNEDIWRALQHTMELFGWLARETAQALAIEYPTQAEQAASDLVQQLYSER